MKPSNQRRLQILRKNLPLHLFLLPGVVLALLFSYLPMVGIVIAFEDYNPVKGFFGSPLVGFKHFEYLLKLPDIGQVVFNTFFIAILKMITRLVIPVIFALLINEIVSKSYKKAIQSLIYFPYFISWVLFAGILIDVLSPSSGIVNQIMVWFGAEPVFFLGSAPIFPYVLVITDIIKEFGFGTVVFLAALTAIDPSLYEAATVDGANKWQRTTNVTIPGMTPIIIVVATLSLGNVLNAGFDQIFNLYSAITYETGDIIDTYVYRLGLLQAQYGVAAAVGLFKSVVSLVCVVVSYQMALKWADYRIF